MKLITRDTDYAIRALLLLAKRKGQVVPAAGLVKELGVPRPFLRKILQDMNKHKILESHKGKGGGFSLAQEPENLYLYDIMKIFQGDFKINECFFKKEACPNTKFCRLKKRIDIIDNYVSGELKSVSISDILK